MSEAALISGKTPTDAAVLLSAFAANRVTDILASRKVEDAGLACDGFQRLAHSVNAGTWFASSMYLWLRRNSAKPADVFPILDITIVVGDGTPSQRYAVTKLHAVMCGCDHAATVTEAIGLSRAILTAVQLANRCTCGTSMAIQLSLNSCTNKCLY
jgi:hypothetical protein